MRAPDPALAAVLRRFRRRLGMTQEALAFEADVTVSALSRIECGRSDPVWSTVRAIAQALDVSMDELGSAVEYGQP
jgi:transcriptional regulator with XRE-family HTH domain